MARGTRFVMRVVRSSFFSFSYLIWSGSGSLGLSSRCLFTACGGTHVLPTHGHGIGDMCACVRMDGIHPWTFHASRWLAAVAC